MLMVDGGLRFGIVIQLTSYEHLLMHHFNKPILKNLQNVLIRLAQRYSGEPVYTQELEDIYELTYKYQMLQQEESLGDYGLPQPLPDRAYMELHKIEPALDNILEDVRDKIINIYDQWIEDHEPSESQFREMAEDDANEWFSYEANIADFIDIFGEDTVKEVLITIVDDYDLYADLNIVEDDYRTEEDVLEFRRKYLEQLELTAQRQKVLPLGPLDPDVEEDLDYPEWEEPKFPKSKENIGDLDIGVFSDVFDTHKDDVLQRIIRTEEYYEYIDEHINHEKERYYADTALGEVKQMREDLGASWEDKDVGDKVQAFQESLTTMHNNDEMAEYVLDDQDATNILNKLSEGEEVPEWNRELSSLLGYELGSKMNPEDQTWFSPVPGLAKVIAVLGRLCKELTL